MHLDEGISTRAPSISAPPIERGTQSEQDGRPRRQQRRAVAKRRRAVLALIALAMGTLGGLGWWSIAPKSFTAESRVSVGDQSLRAAQVPAYAVATQTLASNYARYVDDSTTIPGRLTVPEGRVLDITASPIPESNVIRLRVTATQSDSAVEAANGLADLLLDEVAQAAPDLVEQERAFREAYTAFQAAQVQAGLASATVTSLREDPEASAAEIAAAEGELGRLTNEAATLDLRQQALGANYRDTVAEQAAAPRLVVSRQATGAESDSVSLLQRAVVLGIAGSAALLAIAEVGILRARRLRRQASD